MYRIIAVVVTYNRPTFLNKLLAVLAEEQLERILIIDNSLEDHRYSLTENAILIRSKINIGGAGGYALGIQNCVDFDPDFVWLLDDDAIPQSGALKMLLNCYKEHLCRDFEIGYLCSKVLWADTNQLCKMNIPVFKKSQKLDGQVVSCSFVSVLIRYTKILEVGLPYKEFFIWYDDVEYTTRLSKVSYGLYVEDSIVRHYIPNNLGANFGNLDERNIFKYAHGIRNTVFCHLKDRNFRKLYRLFFRIRKEMLLKDVPINHRLIIYKWYLKGLIFHPEIEYITFNNNS